MGQHHLLHLNGLRKKKLKEMKIDYIGNLLYRHDKVYDPIAVEWFRNFLNLHQRLHLLIKHMCVFAHGL